MTERTRTAAEEGLGASLRTAHRLYIRLLQDHLARKNLTVAQYLHLRVLWEENGLAQNEISSRLGIEKASSTGALDALDREGLVVRERDPCDRRRVKVRLSPKGEEVARTVLPFARRIAEGATAGVPAPDLQAFFATFERIIDNLARAQPRNGRR